MEHGARAVLASISHAIRGGGRHDWKQGSRGRRGAKALETSRSGHDRGDPAVGDVRGKCGMSDMTHAHEGTSAPRRRAFAPQPTASRTHLYECRGPLVWVCEHQENGVLLAIVGRKAVWTHGEPAPVSMRMHPDMLRVAFAWIDEGEARKTVTAFASFAEYERISFRQVRCDVAESRSRGDFVNIDERPLLHASIEACLEASRLNPLPDNRLDPQMRRETRPPNRVSLAKIGSGNRTEGHSGF